MINFISAISPLPLNDQEENASQTGHSMENTFPGDKELVEAFRNETSRRKAFEQILSKYQKRAYWHIRRMVIDHDDADDVVQDTFIKVWENLARFREDSKLYTWIFRIATNEALQFLNKRRMVSLDEVDSELLTKLETSSYFDGNLAERKLQAAILNLPSKQRLVFNLKYYENMKYDDMEMVTGTSAGALKASYHHAVKKIEDYLKGN